MTPKVRLLVWLAGAGCASWLAACGSEAPLPPSSSPGGGAGVSGGGAGGAGGSSGGPPTDSAGQAGTLTAGQGGLGGGGGGASAVGGTAGGGNPGAAGGGGVSGVSGASGAAAAGAGGTSGAAGSGGAASSLPKRVLLYHFSTLTIASVPEQLTLLGARLREWGYDVEESVNPADLNPTKLATLGGVGMINTCFEPFGKGSTGTTQTAALAAFVEAGGGLFGTHCASVTFQTANPPNPYNELIGGRGGDGYFDGTSACTREETHPTTSLLPSTFNYVGNLDNADFLAPDTKVLVRCRWSGGDKKDVPVSWYRASGKGRVFYTNFAKEAVDFKDASLADNHLFLGLGWVLGR